MNKKDLVTFVTEKTELDYRTSELAVTALIDTITETLAAGEKVQLVGFGIFMVKQRPARDGRNPRTGETIKLSVRKVPAFKAGKGLKEKVR
jgi:DNA-binding protein HU-beta